MRPAQQIFRTRRHYNKWVGNETLEDYALRFTAVQSRRWSIEQVAKTALGATAFLALESLSASITLQYGFSNAIAAMLSVAVVIFLTGLPISYYAAKHGLDIDLLTRGAGFGYLGSTITSLIYAAFTFIFFAIEAAILASALHALLGIPPALGYIICAVAVIPIVTHGIAAVSKFQMGTQPFWLVLQLLALATVAWYEIDQVKDWSEFSPAHADGRTGFDLAMFGGATAVLFAMVAQIGEQVDYLRFMPPKTAKNRFRWWFWLILSGPGWILIGLLKMLFGSFLAYLAFRQGASTEQAADPMAMYQMAFNYLTHSPTMALVLAGCMVIISQMKINITNAYAGSIAWSNFFARLTHSHPGRVVWLVFNIMIALILMELGIYRALESVLGVFAIIAISWLGSLAADLAINKPLKLSPATIEFKRAHLYDINPVGVGSMLLSSIFGVTCYLGLWGDTAKHLAHFYSLASCFVLVPLIAWATKGRFYIARQSPELQPLLAVSAAMNTTPLSAPTMIACCICENQFETEDMSHCPAYQGPICSLCCTLDSRCLDRCKPQTRFSQQLSSLFSFFLPKSIAAIVHKRLGKFILSFISANVLNTAVLTLLYLQINPATAAEAALLLKILTPIFFLFLVFSGIIIWLLVLTHESRVTAQRESNHQTQRLLDEVDAHQITDAALQLAKEQAEHASAAKSRYLTGISHELRTPLQSVLGYAQLLKQKQDIPAKHHHALDIIHRSGNYLTDLIEGLLHISKIEAGRLEIYRNQVKLPELLQQMVEMFQPQATAKGLVFNYHLHNQLPKVVIADEKHLRQILINLFSNAIKYTLQGQIDFHVHYRNQVAKFSVNDTGIGIDNRDLQRILDPFERVRSAAVADISGTGLGLTITKLLTESMGGDLNITSNLGSGSCFCVSLMLSRVDIPIAELSSPQMISGYRGASKSVLVVDDEPIHRGLLCDILTPLGFNVSEAQDANHCLQMLASTTPDLFILDVSMPGMNGLELASELKRKHIHAPIIMLSADAQERHRRPDDNSVHDVYMVKPLNNQKLLNHIGQLLQLKWLYAAEITPTPLANLVNTAATPVDNLHTDTADFTPLHLPEHPLLRVLLSHAKLGYKKGVQTTLDTIESEALLSADGLAYLQQLAQTMHFDQMTKILESNVC